MSRFSRFTIRDLAWLTLAVALALGWWMDRKLLKRQQAIEKEAILQQAADIVHEATSNFGE